MYAKVLSTKLLTKFFKKQDTEKEILWGCVDCIWHQFINENDAPLSVCPVCSGKVVSENENTPGQYISLTIVSLVRQTKISTEFAPVLYTGIVTEKHNPEVEEHLNVKAGEQAKKDFPGWIVVSVETKYVSEEVMDIIRNG